MENGLKKNKTDIYVQRNTHTPFKWPRCKDRDRLPILPFCLPANLKWIIQWDGYTKKKKKTSNHSTNQS